MNKGTTILNQLLRQIPRFEFQKAMETYKVEKHAKGLSSWNQFVAMAYGQITNQRSLKNIESGLRSNASKLYHHGVDKTSKSTLAYANENRDYRAYAELFSIVLEKAQRIAPKSTFSIGKKIKSMDATIIDLCMTQFPWAEFRKTKSGIQLLIKMDHNGNLPEHVQITNAIEHETQHAWNVPFSDEEFVAFDRGFSDYSFYASLYSTGTSFVTRLKKNAKYIVVECYEVNNDRIISDEKILFTGYNSQKRHPMALRKIKAVHPETGETVDLLTNDFTLPAEIIAEIYRERWQIEIFFKMLKQFLRIKKYYGNSKNAVLTQVFIALILYLLIQMQRFTSTVHMPFSTFLSIISSNAFQKYDLSDVFSQIQKPPNFRQHEKSMQGVLF